jgi:hypothetical protein
VRRQGVGIGQTVVLAALCGCAAARAAEPKGHLSWTQERTEIRKGKRRDLREQVQVTRQAMRIADLDTGSAIVLRLDRGEAWLLEPRKGVYRSRTFKELTADRDERWEAFRKERAKKDARLKRIRDVKIRERMKRMYERQAYDKEIELGIRRPKVTIRKTGKTRAIRGLACEEIVVTSEETKEPMFSGWVSPRVGHEDLLRRFREKLSFFAADLASTLERAGAFPVEGEVVARKGAVKVRIRFRVTSLSTDPVAPAAFERPAGLKRQPWEEEE